MATVTDLVCVSDQVASKRKRSRSGCCSSSHPVIDVDGNCVICRSRTSTEEQEDGKKIGVDNNRFLPFDYVQNGLKIGPSFLSPVRKVVTKRLLEQKKLVLVLDIDHTLLHTIFPSGDDDNVGGDNTRDVHTTIFSREEKTGETAAVRMMKTKLRPLVLSFLKLVSPMYEMYLYTHGSLHYAMKIKKILDPNDFYFKNKVITKEDSVRMGSERKIKHMDLEVITKEDSVRMGSERKIKHMDLVLAETNLIVVIDDKPSKWIDHPSNVIRIKKYEFPPFIYEEDYEDEGDDILLHMYFLLQKIYQQFYDSRGNGTKDVREVMQTIRRETLKGCKIVVIGGQCSNINKDDGEKSRQLVEKMGGSCCKEISDEVTHVVVVGSPELKNQDVVINWALKNGKFVVSRDWLVSANYSWTRPKESNFTFFHVSPLALD